MCQFSSADVPDSISFDSLKSLPTTLPWLRKQQAQAGSSSADASSVPAAQPAAADGLPPVPGQVASLMRRPTFEAVAAVLRKRLGLTLFGFDLVFDSMAGGARGWGLVYGQLCNLRLLLSCYASPSPL